MKILKQNMIILLVVFIMTFLAIVNLVSATDFEDTKGDIYHHKVSSDGTTWIYEKSTLEKNDLDINKISYSASGTTLTVTIEIYGQIQSSNRHAYIFYYNTSDATYIFTYSHGQGSAIGQDWDYFNDPDSIDIMEIMEHMKTGTFSAEGSQLTGSIEIIGSTEPENVWCCALEYNVDYSSVTDVSLVEWYGDYWPNNYAPWHGTETEDNNQEEAEGESEDPNDDGTQDGTEDQTGDSTSGEDSGSEPKTPGFEIITLISAIALAFVLLKRKKK